MNCPDCGEWDVAVGAPCPACGGVVAVASDALDSLLSQPAEPVPEAPEEEPTSFEPLAVVPGSVGPATDVDPDVVLASSTWQEDEVAPPPPPAAYAVYADPTAADSWSDDTDLEAIAAASTAAEAAASNGADGTTPERSSGPPLPQRTPIDATPPQWGPRDHPPAVLAPPPPHPLDAPAVARVKRPSGTGLPAVAAAGGPAPSFPVPPAADATFPIEAPAAPPPAPIPPPGPTVPTITPAAPPSGASTPPEPASHPRVRRWFGRGTGPDPDAELDAPNQDLPVAEDPFPGAPDGLLDGVSPEPDVGDDVNDPAAVEAAMSRLSAGARRAVLAPLSIVAALLDDGEVAEAVVQGEYQHRPGVVVLTDRRLLVANDRRWSPDVRTFGFEPTLVVHGWQDDRRATLVFVLDGVGVLVGAISDRPLARDLAQRVRARCAGGPPGVTPPG